MSRLKDKYNQEILPKLKEEFNISNALAVPRLKKVVINVGIGDAKDNKSALERIIKNLTDISGQKAVVTKAKNSIAGFKLAKGDPIGVMVTLRGERMYVFLDKLVNIVLPKIRDFRGVPSNSFDGQGNFSLGLKEQSIFPEIPYQSSGGAEKVRGLQISIVTDAKKQEQGRRLLELLGMPFKAN